MEEENDNGMDGLEAMILAMEVKECSLRKGGGRGLDGGGGSSIFGGDSCDGDGKINSCCGGS